MSYPDPHTSQPEGQSPGGGYPPPEASPSAGSPPPFGGAAFDPHTQYGQQPARRNPGAGLRPTQWAAIVGLIICVLGLVVGGTIGGIIAIVGAIGLLVGVVDAVRTVLAERRET